MFSTRHKSSPRLFGRSTSAVLRSHHQPVVWRLEVQEDANDRGMVLSNLTSSASYGSSMRLANYISAGGMRDLQPGRHADINASRRQFVIRLALFLLAFWLFFLFWPCG